MLQESYFSSVWLAWCYVKSSPAGRERARREAEEQEREWARVAAERPAPEKQEVPEESAPALGGELPV